jgi:DNA adenine methylase
VYSFWKSVLAHTEHLNKLIIDTPLTVKSWDVQKRVLEKADDHDEIELGFATFFLNRTNRSGILNGGIIGGRDQTGPWKIDARYNAPELVHRINAIAGMKNRIKLTQNDALQFLKTGTLKWPEKTLIYLDPPYYVKGRDLYYDFYEPRDHAKVAVFIRERIQRQKWIISYDNVPAIRDLYKGAPHIVYDIGYSARSASRGSEVMFFGPGLFTPALVGPIHLTEDHTQESKSA